jgi:CBS domain-containing protein
MSEQEIKPISEELVKDAQYLIVCDPAKVKLGSKVFAAVEEVLRDPRTETVYVVDDNDKLKGIISVRDLLKVSSVQIGSQKRIKLLNFFKYMNILYSETVEDIMQKPVTVRNETKLLDALLLMEKNDMSDLPVIDSNNVIIGELNGLELLTVIHKKIKSGELEKLV